MTADQIKPLLHAQIVMTVKVYGKDGSVVLTAIWPFVHVPDKEDTIGIEVPDDGGSVGDCARVGVVNRRWETGSGILILELSEVARNVSTDRIREYMQPRGWRAMRR